MGDELQVSLRDEFVLYLKRRRAVGNGKWEMGVLWLSATFAAET